MRVWKFSSWKAKFIIRPSKSASKLNRDSCPVYRIYITTTDKEIKKNKLLLGCNSYLCGEIIMIYGNVNSDLKLIKLQIRLEIELFLE